LQKRRKRVKKNKRPRLGKRRFLCPKCKEALIGFVLNPSTLTYQKQGMCRKCARKAKLDLGQKKIVHEKQEEKADDNLQP
jgi:hypothetical protein